MNRKKFNKWAAVKTGLVFLGIIMTFVFGLAFPKALFFVLVAFLSVFFVSLLGWMIYQTFDEMDRYR